MFAIVLLKLKSCQAAVQGMEDAMNENKYLPRIIMTLWKWAADHAIYNT
jgi:hypothetical protein